MMKLNGIDDTVTAVMSYFNSENLSENFPLYNNPEGDKCRSSVAYLMLKSLY